MQCTREYIIYILFFQPEVGRLVTQHQEKEISFLGDDPGQCQNAGGRTRINALSASPNLPNCFHNCTVA